MENHHVEWENHGKTMGKPWENHGKTMGKPWENHGKMVIYMENHFFFIGKSTISTGPFSIAM